MIPHMCPVYNGQGLASRPPWIPGDIPRWDSSNAGATYQCRACGGTGIIWQPIRVKLDERYFPKPGETQKQEQHFCANPTTDGKCSCGIQNLNQ
jgi:hypothetical protein